MAHIVECILDAVEAAGADVAAGEVDEAILACRTVVADQDLALRLVDAEYAVQVYHFTSSNS